MLGGAPKSRNYRVMADLSEESTFKFLSWCRFVEFDGDMMVLAQAKIRDEKKNRHQDG